MLESILNKLDKAEANDIYYLAIALGQGIPNANVPSDIYYAIYLKQLHMVNEYDLY